MKKLLTFLTLLTLFFTTAGAETTTVTASKVTQSTFTWTGSGGETWSGKVTGGATNQNVINDYAQIGTKNSPSTKVELSTDGISGTITSIVIDCASYNGLATVSALVNGNPFGTQNQSTPSWSNSTGGEVTFTGSASGDIIITMKNGSGGRAMYIKSITVTYEEGSTPVTPRVETPVITLSQDAPYYVGDNVTASITCGTEGAAIVYSLDNGTTWNPYSTAVEIPSTTAGTVTIKAKATKADYLDSYEATQEVNFVNPPTTFNNLAAVNGCDDGTEFTFTAQTVVLAKNGRNMYIVMPDNSAGSLIYANSNWGTDYTFGKIINSGWEGSKTTFRTKPEVQSPSGFSLNGETAELTPIVVGSNADLTLANFGRYAVINNVQVAADGTVTGLAIYNQFGLSFTNFEAGKYDVYGVIGWDSDAGQFMPLEYRVHQGAYSITVTQPDAGGTISADATTADEGEEITLTAIPSAGYELTSWVVKDASDNDVAVTDNKFTMPASNVTVTATFSKIWYTITCVNTPTDAANAGNAVWLKAGFDNTNGDRSQVDNLVRFKVHTVNGWQIDNVTAVYGENNTAITLSEDGTDNLGEYGNEGSWASDQYGTWYSFTMPAGAVTITGTFRTYVSDLYILGTANGNDWAGNVGVKMDYSSSTEKYTKDVYFAGNASDGAYGFFNFTESLGNADWSNMGTRYGSKVQDQYDLEAHNYTGELSWWDEHKGNAFKVPAGVYTIEVDKDKSQVTVTPKTINLTFNPAAGEVVSGTEVTVSSNLYELLSAINSNITENDVTNMVKTDGDFAASVTIIDAATVTGRAKYGYIEQTATAEYTISQENTNTQYKLIKSAEDLVNGKKYLVVGTYPSANKTFVMGAYSEPRLSAVDATPENDIIEATADMRIVTLEAVGTNWALKTDDGYVYTNSTTSNGYAAYVENQEPAVVIFESETTGELNIKFVNNDDKGYLTPQRFGNSSNYFYGFGGYASATSVNASHLFLYRQVEEVVTLKVETPVITPGTGTYAEAKDVEITCSTPGATIWYKYGNMTDYAEYTEALTISENTTLSAYATKDGYNDSDVATATYTFSELSDEIFTLVTSEDQLIEGNEYIIVAATDTYKPALGAIESRNGTPANGYTFETAGDYSVLTLAAESDVNIFTLGKVEVTDPNDKFYWTFKDKDGNFLYADESGGAIDTDNQSNYSHVYKINIGEGTHYNNYATIQGSANFQIEYRTDIEIFRHYSVTNVTQQPNLYKKVLLYTRGVQQTPSMTLAQIESEGVVNTKYAIADPYLVAVASREVSVGVNSYVYVWCKDNKNVASPITVGEGVIDFMRTGNNAAQAGDWDQSNWVVLRFNNDAAALALAGSKLTNVVGTYVDNNNYMIDVESYTKGDTEVYTPNVYCVANFNPDIIAESGMATQENDDNTYFFMPPKVQEVCTITFAEWNGTAFQVPASSGFAGTLTLGWDYNQDATGTPVSQETVEDYLDGKLEDAEEGETPAYKFLAVVQNNSSKGAVTGATKVYPMDLVGEGNDIPTAINGVVVNGIVKSVKYVNVAGMVSDVPFQGVNIVVTEYSDGSRSTSKMLRK